MTANGEEEESTLEDQWVRLQACYQSGQPFLTTAIEATHEGVIVDVGGLQRMISPWHYAFRYALLGEIKSDQDKEEQLLAITMKRMKGQAVRLRVKEVDREHNHVLLSQYMMTEEERQRFQARREALLREVQPGDIRQGTISALHPHSISVDLGGVPGHIFIHELSWDQVKEPSEIVHIGQEVKVLVLSSGPGSITLSMKRAQQSEELFQQLQPGDRRQGRIFALADAGAFVDIGRIYGLIPTSQLVHGYITHLSDLFHLGQELEVIVVSIDRAQKKIVLTLQHFD